MKSVCFGLIFVFFCDTQQPAVVSDFCQQAGPSIVQLRRMTDAELAALTDARKRAIGKLRKKYTELCK